MGIDEVFALYCNSKSSKQLFCMHYVVQFIAVCFSVGCREYTCYILRTLIKLMPLNNIEQRLTVKHSYFHEVELIFKSFLVPFIINIFSFIKFGLVFVNKRFKQLLIWDTLLLGPNTACIIAHHCQNQLTFKISGSSQLLHEQVSDYMNCKAGVTYLNI